MGMIAVSVAHNPVLTRVIDAKNVVQKTLSFFRINATQALKMQLTQRLCCMIPESMDRTVPYEANFIPANRPRAT